MATITNTVQGLNETIGLLKQILGAVQKDNKKQSESKGGEKNVQAKDISSSAILLSKIGKKGSKNIKSVILAFEPLSKVKDDKLGEKAKNIAEAIKILSTENIIKGLKQYEKVNSKMINRMCSFISMFTLKIQETADKIDVKKMNAFLKVLTTIVDIIQKTTMILYYVAGLVLVAALVGVLTIFAWKYILLGFAVITTTIFGIIFISSVLYKVAKMQKEIIDSIKIIILSLYAISGMVLVAALVGILTVYAWEYVLIGFGAIVGVVFGIVIISHIIKMVAENIDDLADSILITTATIILAGGVVLVAALVGVVALKAWEYVLIGFGAIVATFAAIVGLSWLAKGTAKIAEDGVKSLIGISLFVMSLAGVILLTTIVALFIEKTGVEWKNIIGVFIFGAVLFTSIVFMIKILNKIKIDTKETLIMAGIVLLLMGLTKVMKKILNISILLKENNMGWKEFLNVLGMMVVVTVTIGTLMAAIGALTMNPIVAIVIAVGAVTMLAINGVIMSLCNAIKNIIDAGKKAKEIGIDEVPIIAKKMANALTTFIKTINKELNGMGVFNVSKLGIIMIPITKIINTCSKFLDMISSFSTEDCKENEIRQVYYDSNIGKYKLGPKIDISKVGENIGKSFGSFISSLTNQLNEFTPKSKRALQRLNKSGIKEVMDSCSSFANMISSMCSGGDGILSIYEKDNKGNFKKDREGNYITRKVDISGASLTIASSFTNFVEKLSDELDKPGRVKRRLRKLKKSGISDIIATCSSFVELISSFAGIDSNDSNVLKMLIKDEKGNFKKKKDGTYITRDINMTTAGTIIANGLIGFVNSLSVGLKGADTDDIKNFSGHFEKITNSFDNVTKSIFSIDDAKAKKLKEHTDAINKFAEAVGKVSQSIDVLNSKEIDLKLDQLKEGINMKISLDKEGKINNIEAETKTGGFFENVAEGIGNLFKGSSSDNKTQTTVQKIDTESISNAIVEGFKKINMLKVELNQNGGQSINLDGNLTLG